MCVSVETVSAMRGAGELAVVLLFDSCQCVTGSIYACIGQSQWNGRMW